MTSANQDIDLYTAIKGFLQFVADRRAAATDISNAPPPAIELVADPRSSLTAAARFYWNAHLQQRRRT
jgi:hypothetical protein